MIIRRNPSFKDILNIKEEYKELVLKEAKDILTKFVLGAINKNEDIEPLLITREILHYTFPGPNLYSSSISLSKRLKDYGFNDFIDYLDFLKENNIIEEEDKPHGIYRIIFINQDDLKILELYKMSETFGQE